MTFQPEPLQEFTIDSTVYQVSEHPAARGLPYAQEGRQAVVYCLEAKARGEKRALKVFKPRFRAPAMVGLAKRLAFFADLPGLQVCRRTVLTPQHHATLLRENPDLLYGVLMPWVEGPTWMGVVVERRPITPEQSLALARSLAVVLASMEQEGLAHCDLSGPNILLPMLADSEGTGGPSQEPGVALVDVEQMFGPDLKKPELVPGGSPGYAHKIAPEGMWETDADRLSGAVLLAEMLAWCDPAVREASWGESYFDPNEMQRDTERAGTMLNTLRDHWGDGVAQVFDRAWRSDTLTECPTFGEWLVVLPESVEALPTQSRQGSRVPTAAELKAAIDAADAGPVDPIVRDLMSQAEAEQETDLKGALALYREARSLSVEGSRLSGELTLLIQDIERRVRGGAAPVSTAPALQAQPAPEQAPEPQPHVDPIVGELMKQASALEEQGSPAAALAAYREAQSLVPEKTRLGQELALIISDLETTLRKAPAGGAPSISPAAPTGASAQTEPEMPVVPAVPAAGATPESPIAQPQPVPVQETIAEAVPVAEPLAEPEPVVAQTVEPVLDPIVGELLSQAQELEMGGDLKAALATYREARSLMPQGSAPYRETDGLVHLLEASVRTRERLAGEAPAPSGEPAPDLGALLAEEAAVAPVQEARIEEARIEEAPAEVAPVELPSFKPEVETTPQFYMPAQETTPAADASPALPTYRPGREPAYEQSAYAEPVLPTFKPDDSNITMAEQAVQLDPIVGELLAQARQLEGAGNFQEALATYREAQSLVPSESELGRQIAGSVRDLESKMNVGPRVVAPRPRGEQYAAPTVPEASSGGFDLGAALEQVPERQVVRQAPPPPPTYPSGSGQPQPYAPYSAPQPQGQPYMQQPQMAPQGTAATSGASGITGSALDTIYDMGLAAYKRGNWAQASQLLREVAKRQPGYERDGQLATGLLMEVERQMEAEAKGKQAKGKKKAAAMPAGTATSTVSAAVRKAKASGQQGLASRGLLVPLIIAGVVVLLLLVIAAFLLLRPHEPAQGGSQAPNTVEQVAGETGVGIQGTATAQTAQMMAAAQAVEGTATAQVTALFDVYTHWDLVHEIAGHTDEVRSVAFSSDGKTLASGSYDQSVRLWNTTDWSAAGVLTGPARPVLSVAFSPDGSTVAAGSDEGKVWLWKLSDPLHPSQLDHGGRVFSVAYSPDGKFLASGSGDTGDTNVKIWDLQGDPKPAVRTLLFTRTDEMKTAPAGGQVPSNNYIRALAFSPDGNLLATGSADKLIRLWQVQGTSSSPALTLVGHTGIVYTVAFSPDGKLLASGSNDMTVRLWSLPDGKPFGKPLSDQTASITGVAFSPDGRVLASGSSDGTVNVWRVDDGSKLADLKEPSDKTTSVAFAPDGSVLVSGSGAANDGKIRVWGLPAK